MGGMGIFKRRQGRQRRTGADMNLIMTPPVEAGTYLKQSGQYEKLVDQGDRGELRRTLRQYANVNETFCIVLRQTSMFAAKNPKIICKDSQNQAALNACFEASQWQTFFQDFFKEYLISGEATSWARWDKKKGCFSPEVIVNPDNVRVDPDGRVTAFESSGAVDEELNGSLIGDGWTSLMGAAGEELPSDELIRIVHKNAPWDRRGYPYFAPALTALVQKESLDAALYGQLNQLANPLIMASVGLRAGDLGPNSKAWIPTQGQLNSVNDTLQKLLMAKLRIGVFKIGVELKNVFSGVQIANLSPDYDRCEGAILRVVGAGKGLIDGSGGAPFASSAVNRDVYTSFIESLRAVVIEAFQTRIDEAIEKLGLHACTLDKKGNRKETDEPESAHLVFDNEVMKDSNARLQALETLVRNNVPISKQTLADAADMGINIADQLHEIRGEEEMVAATQTEDDVDLQNNPNNSPRTIDVKKQGPIMSPNDKRNY